MNATTLPRSVSDRLLAGIPFPGLPVRTTGPILSPLTSSATTIDRVRSGPVSPPIASRPWQKPHCETKSTWPARICSGEYVCCVTVCGGRCDAGLPGVHRPVRRGLSGRCRRSRVWSGGSGGLRLQQRAATQTLSKTIDAARIVTPLQARLRLRLSRAPPRQAATSPPRRRARQYEKRTRGPRESGSGSTAPALYRDSPRSSTRL